MILLGCTHFPLIDSAISAFFGGALTIHSGEAMLHWMEQRLDLTARFERTPIQIMASENVEAVKRVAARWQLDL